MLYSQNKNRFFSFQQELNKLNRYVSCRDGLIMKLLLMVVKCRILALPVQKSFDFKANRRFIHAGGLLYTIRLFFII